MYQDFLVRWIKRGEKEAERGFVKRVGKFGGRHYVFLYTKQRIDVCARLRLIAARVWRPWFLIPSRSSTVNRPTLLPSLLSPLPWMEGRGVRRFVTMICTKISFSLSLSPFRAPFTQNSTLQFYESNWREFSFLWYPRNTAMTLFSREYAVTVPWLLLWSRYFARQINATNLDDFYVHRILFRHLSMNFVLIISKFPIVFFKGIHGYGNLELFRISLSLCRDTANVSCESDPRWTKCWQCFNFAADKRLSVNIF